MRKNLKDLRAKRQERATAGKAKLGAYNALADKAERTEADESQLTALDAEIAAIEADVEKLDADIRAEESRARREGLFAGSTALTRSPALSNVVNDANPATADGFRSLAEFSVAVRNATVNQSLDPRLATPATPNLTNNGAAGEGFLVPVQFREQIWEMVFNGEDLLSLVTPEPTEQPIVSMPKDETTPWGAAGVQAFWRGKDAQLRASRPVTQNTMVELHALDCFIVADDMLLADAPRLNDRLGRKAADAIRWRASEVIMTGDGVGQPLGFMNSSAKIAIAKEAGQAADTLHVQNIFKAYSRVLRAGGSVAWIGNSDILPQLAGLTIGNQPAWLPNNQPLSGAPEGALLGRPLYFMEHAATVGDEGDLIAINPAGYAAFTKAGGGVDFAASIHLYFDYAKTAFRWTFRMGGQPILSAPVAPAKGGSTKSHFVTIAERA